MEDWVLCAPLFNLLIEVFDIVLFINKSEGANIEFCKSFLRSELSLLEIITHLSPYPRHHFFIPFNS